MKQNIWISQDGTKAFYWPLIPAAEFRENVQSPVDQRDHGKTAYPDKPSFSAGGVSVYFEEALNALASFREFHGL